MLCSTKKQQTKPFYKLLQNADLTKLSRKDCCSSNIQTKIVDKPKCCAIPKNNKQNPFINYFKMPIKLNSLGQTAENREITRKKRPTNQYA